MRKRLWRFLGVALSGIMLAGLTACGGQENTGSQTEGGSAQEEQDHTQAQGEEITLTFYWGSLEDDMQQVWEEVFFAPFEEEHPGVTIDFQCLPEVQETLRVQLAAGSGPDLFMLDCFDVPDYVEAGALKNLDTYREQYGWDDIIYDWALDAGCIDGSLYGVAHSSEATSMYYNKDILDELGMSVPETREEFTAVCDAAAEAGYIPIEYGYSGANENQQWIYDHYLGTYAGRENLKKLFTGQLKFTDPEIQGAFQVLKEDWDKGYINQGQSGAITNDEARTFFQNGQAVFSTEGTWLTLENFAPGTLEFEWGCTKWPSMKDGIPASGSAGIGAVMAINENTEQADLCAELINYFYSDEQRLADAVATGYPTLCRSIDDSLYPDDMAEDVKKTLEAIDTILADENVGYAPWSAYPSDTNIYLMNNLDKIYYGDYTVEQFCQEAQDILDQELAEGFVFVG